MSQTAVAGIYAAALLDLAAQRGFVTEVVAEAAELRKAVLSEANLLTALDAPGRPQADSMRALRAALGGRVHEELLRLVELIMQRGRIHELPEVLAAIGVEADRRAGVVDVDVVSAAEIGATNRARLIDILRRRHGPGVRVAWRIDSALRGGLTVRVGDRLVDGSVASRLHDAHELILSVPVPADAWDAATGMWKAVDKAAIERAKGDTA